MTERTPCPHCGRPMGFEYCAVEKGKCQLWRVMSEGADATGIDPRTLADCFGHTSQRLRKLEADLADARETLKVAQRALSRHHAAANATSEPFRDDARIE